MGQAAAQAKRASEAQRITFAQYADEYLAWCQQVDVNGEVRKRSWRTIKAEMSRLRLALGAKVLKTLGNWRSLSMVERYSHLSPDHLRSAVENW